jgi:hypothetical protein
MDNRNVLSFKSVNDSLPYIPRGVYNAVDSHVVGRSLLPDMAISKLDYLIASTNRADLCDISFNDLDLRAIAHRLPVLAACGGYYAGKGPPSTGKIGPACVPTPLTPAHLHRVIKVLQRNADRLNVSLDGLDDLHAMIELIFEAGVSSGRFYPREDPDADAVVYKHTDRDIQQCSAAMGERSNSQLLESLYAGWINISANLLTNVFYNRDKTVDLEIVRSEFFVNPRVVPVSNMLIGRHVLLEQGEHRLPYAVISCLNAQTAYKAIYGYFIRLLQTEYCLNFGKPAPQLTTTQIKLFCTLRVLVAYYGLSISDYAKTVKVLDLCSDPNKMAELLVNLGAVVHVQSMADHELTGLFRSQTIPPWFNMIIPMQLKHYQQNILDHSDDHSFDLAIADGYSDESVDETLFWLEIYVSLYKLKYGGSLIMKTMSPWTDIFGVSLPTPTDLIGDPHVDDFVVDPFKRTQLFSRFSHFCIVKPLGSTPQNRERYLVFLGYRPMPAYCEPVDPANVKAEFDNFEVRHSKVLRKIIKSLKIDTQPLLVPDDLAKFLSVRVSPSFIPLNTDRPYDGQLTNVIMSRLKTVPLVVNPVDILNLRPVIDQWNQKFTLVSSIVAIDRDGVRVTIPIHVPVSMVIHFNANTRSGVVDWMNWGLKAVSILNHKAYVLELLQSRNLANKFKLVTNSNGPQNNPSWRATIYWDVVNADYRDEFVSRVINRDFTSPYLRNKKDAEQTCYRKVIEIYYDFQVLPLGHLSCDQAISPIVDVPLVLPALQPPIVQAFIDEVASYAYKSHPD